MGGAFGGRYQDLPVQSDAVMVEIRVARWRRRSRDCGHSTFVERLPPTVAGFALRSCRAIQVVRLLGCGAGGRQGAIILRLLGMPVGDDTVLRLGHWLSPRSSNEEVQAQHLGDRRHPR
jgi:hypothetical protein